MNGNEDNDDKNNGVNDNDNDDYDDWYVFLVYNVLYITIQRSTLLVNNITETCVKYRASIVRMVII